MRRYFRIIPTLLLLIAIPALAKTTAPTYPKPVGYVNDFAGILTPETRNGLESLLTVLENKTSAEISVVTLPSLNDEPIENVAVDLFQQWGIGKKGKDHGLLFLIAPNERKLKIEVGYGLESILPDGLTGRIRDTYVIPEFKKGDFNTGIMQGTQAMVQIVAKDAGVEIDANALPPLPDVSDQPQKSSLLKNLFQLGIIILIVILFIRNPSLFLLLLFSGVGGGGGSGRSSGGFGGGFGGFGGGGSGGGGCSGSW